MHNVYELLDFCIGWSGEFMGKCRQQPSVRHVRCDYLSRAALPTVTTSLVCAYVLHTTGCTLQLPFIGWTGDIPLAGPAIQKALQAAARPFVNVFLARTGSQFFLEDKDGSNIPTLVHKYASLPESSMNLFRPTDIRYKIHLARQVSASVAV